MPMPLFLTAIRNFDDLEDADIEEIYNFKPSFFRNMQEVTYTTTDGHHVRSFCMLLTTAHQDQDVRKNAHSAEFYNNPEPPMVKNSHLYVLPLTAISEIYNVLGTVPAGTPNNSLEGFVENRSAL
jgi:hypothetical protein